MAATLATVTNVKERLSLIQGGSLPAGLTDARIQDILDEKENIIAARFGEDVATDLTTQQKSVGKNALITIVCAELRKIMLNRSEESIRACNEEIRMAYEDVDNTLADPEPAGRKEPSFEVV